MKEFKDLSFRPCLQFATDRAFETKQSSREGINAPYEFHMDLCNKVARLQAGECKFRVSNRDFAHLLP
jgi:hypothetical protein